MNSICIFETFETFIPIRDTAHNPLWYIEKMKLHYVHIKHYQEIDFKQHSVEAFFFNVHKTWIKYFPKCTTEYLKKTITFFSDWGSSACIFSLLLNKFMTRFRFHSTFLESTANTIFSSCGRVKRQFWLFNWTHLLAAATNFFTTSLVLQHTMKSHVGPWWE